MSTVGFTNLNLNSSTNSGSFDATISGGGSLPSWMKIDTDYGVIGNGTTDDTAALQSFLSSAASGDHLFFTCGAYKISDTLTLGNGSISQFSTVNNVTLHFRGGTYLPDGYYDATPSIPAGLGARFKWAGSGTKQMLKLAGPIYGVRFDGAPVMLDGSATSGITRLEAISLQGSTVRAEVYNCPIGYNFDCLAATNIGGQYNGLTTAMNTFRIAYAAPDIVNGVGIKMDGYKATGGHDVTQNVFENVQTFVSGTGGVGIRMGFCDGNIFHVVDNQVYGTPDSNCADVLLVGGATPFSAPENNHIRHWTGRVGFKHTGTPGLTVVDTAVADQGLAPPSGSIIDSKHLVIKCWYNPSDVLVHGKYICAQELAPKYERVDVTKSSDGEAMRLKTGGMTASFYLASTIAQFGTVSNHPFRIMVNNTEVMRFNTGGAIGLPAIADSAAGNSTFYNSSTQGKLCWKDGSGVVKVLY